MEDQTYSLLGLVPEGFHVAEGSGLGLELEGGFGGILEEGGDGLTELIEGGAAEAAAQELEARAAQDGCGQVDGPAGAMSDLNVANA